LNSPQIASVLLALSCRRQHLHQTSVSDAQWDRRDRSELMLLARQHTRGTARHVDPSGRRHPQYMMKPTGLKTDPCGTLQSTGKLDVCLPVPSCVKSWIRPVKYDSNQFIAAEFTEKRLDNTEVQQKEKYDTRSLSTARTRSLWTESTAVSVERKKLYGQAASWRCQSGQWISCSNTLDEFR